MKPMKRDLPETTGKDKRDDERLRSALAEHLTLRVSGIRTRRRGILENGAYDELFRRLAETTSTAVERTDRERRRARAWVETLRPLPPGRRSLRVRNAAPDLRGRVFEIQLLAEARAALVAGDAEAALGWTGSTLQALETRGAALPNEEHALATAFEAVALDRLGAPDERDERLRRLKRDYLEPAADCLSPGALAELYLHAGALHRERGEPEAASELLGRSVRLHRSLGEVPGELQARLEIARTHLAAGRTAEARIAWERAELLRRESPFPLQAAQTALVRAELTAAGELPACEPAEIGGAGSLAG